MSEQQTCGDSGDNSPQAEMNYTLVGKGWRVVRCEAPEGRLLAQWRCPSFGAHTAKAAEPPHFPGVPVHTPGA